MAGILELSNCLWGHQNGWMFPGDELGQEGHFPERVTQRKLQSWSQEWECTRCRAVRDFRMNSNLGGYGS